MSTAAILVLGLALVLGLPLAWRALAGSFDPFEPVVLFAVAYGTVFVARPVYMLAQGELSFAGVDIRETFPVVTALGLAGGVAFLVGYHLRPGAAVARRLPAPRQISARSGVAWSLALSALAGLALLALWAGVAGNSDELGSATVASDYVANTARLFVPAALCLFALALRDGSGRLWLAAGLVLAASLAELVPEGRRIFLLPLLGGMLVFAYVRRQRRPSALVLLALAIAAVFASYAAVVVREPERRAEAGSQFAELVRRPHHVLDLVLKRGDAEMAQVLAGALTVVPDRLGYRYGAATVGDLLARPIPRQLWQGKPQPASEQVISAVWPDYEGTTFHPAFTPLLSFYWDFGIAGVMAGMALFGVACRMLYEWFMRHRESLAAQLIYSAAVWYVVIGVRNDPVETVVLASFVVLPLVLIERFSGARLSAIRPRLARARPFPR